MSLKESKSNHPDNAPGDSSTSTATLGEHSLTADIMTSQDCSQAISTGVENGGLENFDDADFDNDMPDTLPEMDLIFENEFVM